MVNGRHKLGFITFAINVERLSSPSSESEVSALRFLPFFLDFLDFFTAFLITDPNSVATIALIDRFWDLPNLSFPVLAEALPPPVLLWLYLQAAPKRQ